MLVAPLLATVVALVTSEPALAPVVALVTSEPALATPPPVSTLSDTAMSMLKDIESLMLASEAASGDQHVHMYICR